MSTRKRLTAEEWSVLIQAQFNGGQTIKAFCKSHQIKEHNFYYWRTRLLQSKEEEEGFIPLRSPRTAKGAMVLRLGRGMELEVPADYSVTDLTELINALRC